MLKYHKFISALFFPAGSLCFLVAGIWLSPHLTLLQVGAKEAPQRIPGWANSNRRVILHQQYHFYKTYHRLPGMETRAAAFYNQCADESDPSALRGTNLPRHIFPITPH